MEQITSKQLAARIKGYLQHEWSLSELVSWAEDAMYDGEFANESHNVIRDIVSRLGVADVRAFGLSWEDCEQFLLQLGYKVHVELVEQR